MADMFLNNNLVYLDFKNKPSKYILIHIKIVLNIRIINNVKIVLKLQ